MPKEVPKPKPLLLLLAVGLLIYFAINISSTLYRSVQGHQRLLDLQQQVSQTQKKRDDLQKQLAFQQLDSFVEQQARNQLSMAKPNETVVIFPRQQTVLGSTIARGKSKASPASLSLNLELWTKLFW